jgi:hypothetical protein
MLSMIYCRTHMYVCIYVYIYIYIHIYICMYVHMNRLLAVLEQELARKTVEDEDNRYVKYDLLWDTHVCMYIYIYMYVFMYT